MIDAEVDEWQSEWGWDVDMMCDIVPASFFRFAMRVHDKSSGKSYLSKDKPANDEVDPSGMSRRVRPIEVLFPILLIDNAACMKMEGDVMASISIYANAGGIVTIGALNTDPARLFWHYFHGDGSPMSIDPDFLTQLTNNNPDAQRALREASRACADGGSPARHVTNGLQECFSTYVHTWYFRILATFSRSNCNPCWTLTIKGAFDFEDRRNDDRSTLGELLARVTGRMQSLCGWKPFQVQTTVIEGCE